MKAWVCGKEDTLRAERRVSENLRASLTAAHECEDRCRRQYLQLVKAHQFSLQQLNEANGFGVGPADSELQYPADPELRRSGGSRGTSAGVTEMGRADVDSYSSMSAAMSSNSSSASVNARRSREEWREARPASSVQGSQDDSVHSDPERREMSASAAGSSRDHSRSSAAGGVGFGGAAASDDGISITSVWSSVEQIPAQELSISGMHARPRNMGV